MSPAPPPRRPSRNMPAVIRVSDAQRPAKTSSLVSSDSDSDEEPLRRYVPGGYHPVCIGDDLGGAYRILRKLGWSARSTVWMVENRIDGTLASLEVLTATATASTGHTTLGLLRRIRAFPDDPGYPHIAHLHAHFYVSGPHGRHLCLVSDLVAQPVAALMARSPRHRIPPTLVRTIVKQAARALGYLHRCGVLYTGAPFPRPSPVHARNITPSLRIKPDVRATALAFVLPPHIDKWALLCDTAHRHSTTHRGPTGARITRFQTQRIPYIMPAAGEAAWGDLRVKLVDVGAAACWLDPLLLERPDVVRSTALRPPELYADVPDWGPPVDVWGLGCLAFELALGRSLVPIGTDAFSVPYLHVLQLGPYPPALLDRARVQPFPSPPLLTRVLTARTTHRVSLLRTAHALGPRFASFLETALTLDPADRPRIRDLLAHPWFADEGALDRGIGAHGLSEERGESGTFYGEPEACTVRLVPPRLEHGPEECGLLPMVEGRNVRSRA
ncbi:kinase-like domain-containing protein [Vararia minispora EC-137]|uniref:Kinase-like domain-containing protein n=1 Tax=Vararia minispora EC-137 TaxID=1314806 RepID=A0ACB8QTG9_9AGAM|nr:kinase-like domain-containing protein [Vararia minispora EC-137]